MEEATILNLGIGFGTVLLSIGGAWGLIRSGVAENTRRIAELETDGKRSKGEIWKEITNQGKTLASVDTKVDILLAREEK